MWLVMKFWNLSCFDNMCCQQEFLRNMAHPCLGLETLAIVFSLPYVLLMWRWVLLSDGAKYVNCVLWIFLIKPGIFLCGVLVLVLTGLRHSHSICHCDSIQHNLDSHHLVHMDIMGETSAIQHQNSWRWSAFRGGFWQAKTEGLQVFKRH